MKLEPPTSEIVLDPRLPVFEHGGVIVEQREVVYVAHIGRPQYFGCKMVEAIEIEIGEELARQVSDRQAAAALEGGEKVVAIEVKLDRLLPVRGIGDQVHQR